MEMPQMPLPQISVDEMDEATIQEYNEYLDWLETCAGQQELPEDFSF